MLIQLIEDLRFVIGVFFFDFKLHPGGDRGALPAH